MDQLRFTGLHEDGTHLVVTAADGSDFTVPVDDRLRAALRPSAAEAAGHARAATPREVQTQIRAGLTTQEVCDATGWTVERVQRYEGPILAEREHIAGLARRAHVRTHERSSPAPSLESRVHDRLRVRGVDLDLVSWDSMRPDGGQWSVYVRFMAGQRIRQAGWTFEPSTRSVDAIDDEARWLSEDEQSLPAGAPSTALFGAGMDGPDDLMATMRQRSRRRGHGSGRERKGSADVDQPASHDLAASADPSAVPSQTGFTDEALPLEDLPYDPDTMGLPPAAGREEADPSEADLPGRELSEGDPLEATVSDVSTDSDGDDSYDDGLPESELEPDDDADSDEREATLADFFGDDDDFVEDDAPSDEASMDDEVDTADDKPGDETASAQSANKSSRGRKGRPSVPSWDDIMFGARDQDR